MAVLSYGRFKLAQKPCVVRFFEFLKNLTFLVLLTVPESKNRRFWFFEENIQKSKNHWWFWLFHGPRSQ
jgi:hypothetical protein